MSSFLCVLTFLIRCVSASIGIYFEVHQISMCCHSSILQETPISAQASISGTLFVCPNPLCFLYTVSYKLCIWLREIDQFSHFTCFSLFNWKNSGRTTAWCGYLRSNAWMTTLLGGTEKQLLRDITGQAAHDRRIPSGVPIQSRIGYVTGVIQWGPGR